MKLHKWEIDGLGKAPFECVGMFELPSPSLAEHNPTAYNNAMRELPKGYHCGTCAVCGMPLKYNYLIKSADGQTFSVGSECVLKRGNHEKSLVDKIKAERNAILREKRAAKRQAEWEVREAKRKERLEAEEQKQRERNGGLTDLELYRQRKAAALAKRAELLAPLADFMVDGKGGFCDSVGEGLRNGELPRGRGINIMIDILAKRAGRRNSKAYNAEYDRVSAIVDAAQVS